VIAYAFHPDAEAELEHPEAGSPAGPNRRRVVVARFPYSIVYQHQPNLIRIVAVAHQRRRPGYWRRRK